MRIEKTSPPSFPQVAFDLLLTPADGERWQVLCGDEAHWRVGLYSPAEQHPEDIEELEKHDCPELFLLLSGRLTLLVARDGALQELALEPGRPVLVDAPHCGFCPDGPHTGVAFVVERDRFETEYRAPAEWLEDPQAK